MSKLSLSSLVAATVIAAASIPASAQAPSLTGTWTVEGQNRYRDCRIWIPQGQLVVEPIQGNRYRGQIDIRGRLEPDRSCANPPQVEPSDDDNVRSNVELTVEKDIVTVREIDLDRSFRYRWTSRGLEFMLESCEPCLETTFRYVRK